jgi:hypothetical protein
MSDKMSDYGDWRPEEIIAISRLALKQNLSYQGVLRQALRQYQLVVEGKAELNMLDNGLRMKNDTRPYSV